jgi:Ubiquitin-2 like Rad60 SUMO-like
MQISLDSEENTRDSQQSDQPATLAPPKQPDQAEVLVPPLPERRKSAVQHDPKLQEMLANNARLMAELERAVQDDPSGGCWLLSPTCSNLAGHCQLHDCQRRCKPLHQCFCHSWFASAPPLTAASPVLLPAVDAASEESEQQQQQPEPAASQADAPRVLLVCRTQDHGDLKLRLKCGDPLSKLFAAFRGKAEQKGWVEPGAQLRFDFDGEQLTGCETPKALDMEDEDAIEVTIH